jgi:hypothetical protein
MASEEHRESTKDADRMREHWRAVLITIKAEALRWLWKWGGIIILGVILLSILVLKGYIKVQHGGGGGGP